MGAPNKGDRAKRRMITMRVTEKTGEWLDMLALQSGRSLSQEVEFRLERSVAVDALVASLMGGPATSSNATVAAKAEASLRDDLIEGAEAAADWTGLSIRSIYHLVRTKNVPFTKVGTKIIFRKSELDRRFSAPRPRDGEGQ